MTTIRQKLSAWIALSRPPFHSVGVLPFVLGGVLAWRLAGAFRWDICGWGTLGVVLVMLATYYAGEYWDYAEDTLSGRTGRSRFAGGSGVLQRGLLPRQAALWGSLASAGLAIGVALVLQFGYHRRGRALDRLLLRLAAGGGGLLPADGSHRAAGPLDGHPHRPDDL